MKAPFNLTLDTSRDETPSAFSGHCSPVSHHLHYIKFLPYVPSKSTLFQFKTTAPFSVSTRPSEKSFYIERPQYCLIAACSSPVWKNPAVLACLHGRGVSALRLFFWPFMVFKWIHSSSLSKLFWMASLPSSESAVLQGLVSSTDLPKVYFILFYVTDENITQYWSQYGPLRDTAHCWFPFRHWPGGCDSLDTVLQPVPYSFNNPSIKSILLQFIGKNTV